jgi:hypothetical protein
MVARGEATVTPWEATRFLLELPPELRFAVLVGHVSQWGALGADPALLASLWEVVEK